MEPNSWTRPHTIGSLVHEEESEITTTSLTTYSQFQHRSPNESYYAQDSESPPPSKRRKVAQQSSVPDLPEEKAHELQDIWRQIAMSKDDARTVC